MIGRDVPGDHHHLVGHPPVRHRDAGGRRTGDGAGDPGDHRHRHTRGHTCREFFESPAVDVRIPALEADHELARLGAVDEDLVDRLLLHRPSIGDLRGIDDLHVRAQLGEQRRRRETIGDDHIGSGEQPPTTHRDQIRVTRTTSDERDTGRL